MKMHCKERSTQTISRPHSNLTAVFSMWRHRLLLSLLDVQSGNIFGARLARDMHMQPHLARILRSERGGEERERIIW